MLLKLDIGFTYWTIDKVIFLSLKTTYLSYVVIESKWSSNINHFYIMQDVM